MEQGQGRINLAQFFGQGITLALHHVVFSQPRCSVLSVVHLLVARLQFRQQHAKSIRVEGRIRYRLPRCFRIEW
jgi:hypothetical protein